MLLISLIDPVSIWKKFSKYHQSLKTKILKSVIDFWYRFHPLHSPSKEHKFFYLMDYALKIIKCLIKSNKL